MAAVQKASALLRKSLLSRGFRRDHSHASEDAAGPRNTRSGVVFGDGLVNMLMPRREIDRREREQRQGREWVWRLRDGCTEKPFRN